MSPWVQAIFAVGCSYAAALCAWPLLVNFPERWSRRLSIAALPLVPYVGLAAGPEGPSYDARCARLVIAILGCAVAGTSYLYWARARQRDFSDYAAFIWVALVNPQRLIAGCTTARPGQVVWLKEAMRAVLAGGAVAIVPLLARPVWRTDTVQNVWWVNYFAFVLVLLATATAFGQFAWAIGRMTGYRGRPLVDQVWLSRSPRDFWRRWNWLVHWLLYRYLYVPLGGRRHSAWATLLVFLISGLGHELLIAVSLGRATGHQTAFFLLSGVGVLISPPLERLARWGPPGKMLMRTATIAFMLAITTLMHATLSYYIPQLHAPSWLVW